MESCCVVDGISDYEVVLVTSSITADLSPPTRRTAYLWSQANFSIIKQTALKLCQRYLATHSALTPVDILWNDFMSIFKTLISHVPTKLTTAKHHQPWINGHIKRLTRKKQRAYNQACSTNSAPDLVKCKDIKGNSNMNVANVSTSMYLPILIQIAMLSPKNCGHKSKKLNHTGVST